MLKTPTAVPTRKTTVGAASGVVIGGPISVLLIYALELAGVTVPAEVAAAIATLTSVVCSFAASYFVRPALRDQVVPN